MTGQRTGNSHRHMQPEARDLNHAVELISKHPGTKFGPWEIRPATDLSEMVRQSEARRRQAGKPQG